MTTIPATIEEVDADWLTGCLGRQLLGDGRVTSVAHEQIGIGLGVLSLLYRVTPAYSEADGGPETIVVKLASRHEQTRQVVAGYRFYEREVAFYRDFADRVSLRTARCHHADFDPSSGDFVVVMEDVGGLRSTDQTQGCDPADAELALEHLARHHAAWWENEELLAFSALQTTADEPYPTFIAQQAAQAWPRCEELLGDRLPPALHDLGADFATVGRTMMIEGADRPWTFNHGDFRLDNLFFDDTGGLTVLDWQIGFRTYGANDVGYFLSQSLRTEDRREHERRLLEAYHENLVAGGVDDYGFDELWDDYRRAILFCFNYPMTAAGQLDVDDPAALALVTSMMDRSVAAIVDLDALELRPG